MMSDEYIVFHIEGGCGKNIVATSVVRSIKMAYPDRKLIVVSAFPEVFLHNPNVYRIYRLGNTPYFYENYIRDKDTIILRTEPYHTTDALYQKKSLSEVWCNALSIGDIDIPFITKQPELFPSERELIHIEQTLQKSGPILLLQTNGGSEQQGHNYSWSRDLPSSLIQEVVNAVRAKFDKIIHIRHNKQIQLNHTVSSSDNIRNLLFYNLFADSILCMDSFLQHSAAAFNKPATVGWISTSPTLYGYELHTNILANGIKSHRHNIDSYLENNDWSGSRFYECPYDNINTIFNPEVFINSILKK